MDVVRLKIMTPFSSTPRCSTVIPCACWEQGSQDCLWIHTIHEHEQVGQYLARDGKDKQARKT